ncbi:MULTISPECIES: ABC transporter ATP-binding protein [Vibrio]|jgi:putative ABC transport system ATP-binding protein|uniref:ABC transporter n=2 Tax=Vibrio TaxID=662 RepID=A0A241TBT4_9VIBR|nr:MULTISPECIES: ABC transporter ATP-binding protein [Vibrio]ASI92677.1 ABC transporter [Vibrio mediterranei]AYV24710.1 ABC transporter ATP-binding protein [Vibrio mediterranei]EDL53562.1 predicted ABC-type transport system, ATPase component [Vibrio mediterranei AK1]KFA97927.1 ABC transporter [Vibrio sp. ER1A]MCF4175904.1 ABC transporter ATP-binding protein [Vibrio sp. McD22-P3]
MSSSIIKAESVTKVVSTKTEHLTILENVNLSIQEGESIAIVGTSGAGKSTLMTLLAGLDVPSNGTIQLLEQNISSLDDEARAKIRSDHLGFVFQSFLLIPSLSALGNVTLPCLLKGEDEDTEKAKALLESVGLGHRIDHLPSQLSGGEQQRVAIARAFMTSPKILFADEPTGNLDQNTAHKIVELLFNLNKEHGTTLVLVTHDLTLAKRCDRVFHMNAGKLEEE